MFDDIETVIFDMDGVLINSMEYHAKSFIKCFSEVGVDIEPEKVYRREGSGSYEIIKEITEEKNLGFGEEFIDKLVSRKREIYDEIEDSETFPGIKDLVQELSEKYKLCVVSGSHRDLVEKYLDEYFGGYFDFYVTENDVDKQKPNPDPYLKALNKLDISNDKALVIENAPFGVESAKEANICCLAVASYVDSELLDEADFVVEDHEELADFIQQKLL